MRVEVSRPEAQRTHGVEVRVDDVPEPRSEIVFALERRGVWPPSGFVVGNDRVVAPGRECVDLLSGDTPVARLTFLYKTVPQPDLFNLVLEVPRTLTGTYPMASTGVIPLLAGAIFDSLSERRLASADRLGEWTEQVNQAAR